MINVLFSNKFYYVKLLIGIIVLAVLCAFSIQKGSEMEITIEECLEEPEIHEGKVVSLYDGLIVDILDGKSIYLVKGKRFIVTGLDSLKPEGRNIDLEVIFKKSGQLEYVNHRYSNKIPLIYKSLVSIAALVLTAVTFFRKYRFCTIKNNFIKEVNKNA